jgi:amino acid adenylation domain-containing protein
VKVSTLFELVRRGAEIAPSKTAVCTSGSALTFEELVEGAKRIGSALKGAGIERGDRVGIWMDKTPACMQVLLGAMSAGAAYVPLDPRAPWRRCRAILEDCDVSAVAVDGPRLPKLHSLIDGLNPRPVIIDGDSTHPSEVQRGLEDNRPVLYLGEVLETPAGELPEAGSEDVAYILYTSGSTGSPKGVVHTHRSGYAFVHWVQKTYGIVPDDVFSSHAPFHFDLSICDLYASLGSGASVRLISSIEAMLPPYLVKSVADWGITVWYSVPSILTAMLEVGDLESRGFGDVRVLLFAGEVFPTPQLRRLRRALPRVRLSNLFGPTETNVCTYYDVPGELPNWRSIPIGRACEHLETFVLDDGGNEVGVGVEGTLWVKGDNLMAGYWDDRAKTEQSLTRDPRGGPGVAYCTGDRVRLQEDGNYEFLGRRDHMIKVRGFRVETGEIEAVMATHPRVVEAVVVAIPDDKMGNRIVSSVVPRSGQTLEARDLRSFCGERLPGYMVPEQFEIVGTLPRTSTGKADRQALLAEWKKRKLA